MKIDQVDSLVCLSVIKSYRYKPMYSSSTQTSKIKTYKFNVYEELIAV